MVEPLALSYSRKNPNNREKGKFPWVLKKKKHLEISGVFKKNSWNFHGSWFLAFEIQKEVVTIFQNFQRWNLVFSRISKVKVTKWKFYGFLLEKYILNPNLDFFWNSHCWWNFKVQVGLWTQKMTLWKSMIVQKICAGLWIL